MAVKREVGYFQAEEPSPLDIGSPRKQLAYADVLTEIKKKCFENKGDTNLPPSLPLAPMQSYLQQPSATFNQTRNIRRKRKDQKNVTAIDIKEKAQKSLEDSEKRLKAIEDHMWLHRQEERDLRRAENDIIRQQSNMQRSLKKYENEVSKRRTDETNSILEQEAKFASHKQADLHTMKDATKSKIQSDQLMKQKINENAKKYTKNNIEMNWKYRHVMELLEQKKLEMEKMSNEFEKCLREKEDEQHRLKNQLASLAISLNMEAQRKKRTNSDVQKDISRENMKRQNENKAREETAINEMNTKKRVELGHQQEQIKLEKSLEQKTELVKAKQRQDGRNLIDIRTQLDHLVKTQQLMQQELDDAQLSLLNEKMHERVATAAAKKESTLREFQKSIRDKNQQKTTKWAMRAISRENEEKSKEHQKRLNHLSKLVSRYDNIEHSLFSRARETDSLIKRQNQTLSKLHNELEMLKKANAKKIKEISLTAESAERQLQHNIMKETAELSKILNIREETLSALNNHRMITKEDKDTLSSEKKEHERRVRIADQSQLKSSTTMS